jgi:hypothetical protein
VRDDNAPLVNHDSLTRHCGRTDHSRARSFSGNEGGADEGGQGGRSCGRLSEPRGHGGDTVERRGVGKSRKKARRERVPNAAVGTGVAERASEAEYALVDL